MLASGGCAFIGPKSIEAGRLAYNDAIVATNNQQVLAMLVRTRYGESSGLLAVSSVTANMRIRSNASAEFGFGPDADFEGNLVPLSVGVAYEETPTISYTPVQGEKYLRQFLSPVPLDITVLLLQALRDSPLGMTLLVRSINGIRNPDLAPGASANIDHRFTRLVALLSELSRQGRIAWAQEPGAIPSFVLALTGRGEPFASQVGELYELMGLSVPRSQNGVVMLPVRLGIGMPHEPAMQLETRSLFDLFNIVAASVDVPEEDLASGIAPPLPPVGSAGRGIRIHRSEHRPEEATVAVRHHGWWYFIDPADTKSKLTFKILETLLSARIADAVDHLKSTPLLTVPVSR